MFNKRSLTSQISIVIKTGSFPKLQSQFEPIRRTLTMGFFCRSEMSIVAALVLISVTSASDVTAPKKLGLQVLGSPSSYVQPTSPTVDYETYKEEEDYDDRMTGPAEKQDDEYDDGGEEYSDESYEEEENSPHREVVSKTGNPLDFQNLLGTDFQPGRLVNIFFGLFIMMVMMVFQGYAMWVLGIAFLPGTRSLTSNWTLDKDRLLSFIEEVAGALEDWDGDM